MSLLIQSYSFTFRLANGLAIISSTIGLDRNTNHNGIGFPKHIEYSNDLSLQAIFLLKKSVG